MSSKKNPKPPKAAKPPKSVPAVKPPEAGKSNEPKSPSFSKKYTAEFRIVEGGKTVDTKMIEVEADNVNAAWDKIEPLKPENAEFTGSMICR